MAIGPRGKRSGWMGRKDLGRLTTGIREYGIDILRVVRKT